MSLIEVCPEDLRSPSFVDIITPHIYEDMVFCRTCNSAILCKFISLGFMPFGSFNMFLPKLHENRCIMDPQVVHVGKSLVKQSKKFTFTVDTECDFIINKILPSYHSNNWINGELANAYLGLRKKNSKSVKFSLPRFLTFETRNKETGNLAAVDIGYVYGSMYTSISGALLEKNAGSVLLCAVGKYLALHGIKYWDFGMKMDYKIDLGASTVSRSEWLKIVKDHKGDELSEPLNTGDDEIDCWDLIKNFKITPVCNVRDGTSGVRLSNIVSYNARKRKSDKDGDFNSESEES